LTTAEATFQLKLEQFAKANADYPLLPDVQKSSSSLKLKP
jgi:hypothetical protein